MMKRRVYSNEEVEEAARRYKTKAEFHKLDSALYFCALRRGLMPRFTWLHSDSHLFNEINFVYRYFFQNYGAVYVGRTINPKKRDTSHRKGKGPASSIVFRFASAKGVPIPPMEILECNLSGEDSQRIEDEYVKKYKSENLTILNTGATGIGTSSMGMKRKHTRKKFLEIASHYTTLSDFRREQPALYDAGNKYGWAQECSFLKRRTRASAKFSREYCISIAKECTSRKELARKDYSVYVKMLHNGWLDECDWLKSKHKGYSKLTHSYCMEIAQQYPTLTIMHRERPTIVKKLYKTGWIEECTWLPRRVKHSYRIGSDKRGD